MFISTASLVHWHGFGLQIWAEPDTSKLAGHRIIRTQDYPVRGLSGDKIIRTPDIQRNFGV